MIPAAAPNNDAARVEILKQYGLLDTPSEQAFDDLVALAARICQAPIGLLTLVDRDRQWFKARFNFDLIETPRDQSFCAHTMLQESVLVVADAQTDPRFADNPLVIGEPGIRFYAGAPLRNAEGHALGALCVIDRRPRTLAPEHLHALEILARHALFELEQRRRMRGLVAGVHESERRLGMFADVAPDVMLIISPDGIVEFANAAAGPVFGHAPADLIGRSLAVLQPERLRAGHHRGLRRYLDTGVRRLDWRATETTGLHRDGHEFPIEIAFCHVQRDGRDQFAGFIRDISARRSAEAAIRESEARYRTLVDTSGVGIWHLDRDRRTIYLNPAMLAMLDLASADDLKGRSFRDFLTRESQAVSDLEYARRQKGESSTYEVELIGDRGSLRKVLVSGAPLHDASGAWIGTIGTLVDLTEFKQLEQQVGYLTQFDALTGLPNRTLFNDRLAQALARAERAGTLVAVALVNIDRFKEINDAFGHHVGDSALRAVAARLKEALYRVDTIARLGADEFALVLEGFHDPDDARTVAQRLLDALGAPLAVGTQELFVQVSIGLALHPRDAEGAEALLRVADLALEDAKKTGGTLRRGVRGSEQRHSRRRRLDTGLHRALDHHELQLEYEPMVDARSGRVAGVEALLRWHGAEFGRLPPGEFIPLAEETGLIVPMGYWVLDTACSDLARWRAAGHAGLVVSVNISPRQLQEPDFVRLAAAAAAKLPPGSVELEITESTLMEPGAVVGVLAELREAGFSLSIDDFGTGYSSLAYIKAFPVNKLKIDRVFVGDIGRSSGDEAIVRTIITLARGMGLLSIAEGVETAAQRDFLVAAGCDQLQGYLFSRAVPAAGVPALLEPGSAPRTSPPR